jgi:hypothetical protein
MATAPGIERAPLPLRLPHSLCFLARARRGRVVSSRGEQGAVRPAGAAGAAPRVVADVIFRDSDGWCDTYQRRPIKLFGVLQVGHIQNRPAVLKGVQQHVHWARQANVSLGRFCANTSFPKASEFDWLADNEAAPSVRLRCRTMARHYHELADREEQTDKARLAERLERLKLQRQQAAAKAILPARRQFFLVAAE